MANSRSFPELMQLVLTGDQDAQTELYQRYQEPLHRIARLGLFNRRLRRSPINSCRATKLDHGQSHFHDEGPQGPIRRVPLVGTAP